MVYDFSDVKSIVGIFIKEKLDHKMLLCKKDQIIPTLKKLDQPYFLLDENPTAENIAKLIYKYAKTKKLPIVSVKLWETDSSFAVYEGK